MGYAEHISADRINEVLSYDPETGEFRWKISISKKFKPGDLAGSSARVASGRAKYAYVRVDGKDITSARLAWIITYGAWPKSRLGFKNDDPSDIRISNIYEMNSLNEDYSDKADYLRKHRKKFGREWRNTHLQRSFGIDLAKYSEMVAAQGNRCAICGEPETQMRGGKLKALAVDHNHTTGAVRELLCCDCNQALGKFKDSEAILTSAIAYLRKHMVT